MVYHAELFQEMKGFVRKLMKRDARRSQSKRLSKQAAQPISAGDSFQGLQGMEQRVLLSANAFGHSVASHNFEDINLVAGDSGVITVLDGVDDGTASLDLGSNVITLFGTQYTGANNLFVSDNGLITFGSANASPTNDDLTAEITQAAIAPMWDDWATDADGNDAVLAKFEDVNGDGTNDRLIVEWSDVKRAGGSGGAVTFQAIIRINTAGEESDVVFNYVDSTTGTVVANGGSATIGIKDANSAQDGADPVLISQNTGDAAQFGDGKAKRIATTALDEAAPTVTITDISPDPRNSAVTSVTFTFDGPVVAFDVSDLSLTRDGGDNLLTGSETLESNDGGTTWTLTGIENLTGEDGQYTLTLNTENSQIVDAQLNAIEAGDSDSWTLDTVAPTAAITAVSPDPISGSVNEITITFSKPIAGGFDKADLSLTLDGGANLLDGNETLVSNDGGTTWILGNLAGFTGVDGDYVLTLTALASEAVDAAGNEVAGDAVESFTVDTTAPDAPTINLISDDDSGTLDNDDETNVALATITGTTEAGSSVEVFVGGISVGAADVDGTDWSYTFAADELASGANTVTAKATDAAGNESAASADLIITLDTIAPDAPTSLALHIDSNSGATDDVITSDNTPTITGNGEVDAIIHILNGETIVGTGQVAGDGTFSIVLDVLADGEYSLSAIATDAAGNSSAASEPLAITIDATAPDAPSTPDLDAGSDSGVSSADNLTNVTTPTVSGTGTAGTFVQVLVDGVEDGDLVLVDGNGNWTHTLVGVLTQGEHTITAVAFDTADNESASSAALTVTIDTTAPTADVVNISPDPRNKTVNSITINFSEQVAGFNQADLSLTLEGGDNLLTESQTLSSGNNQNFTLAGTSAVTSGQGTFLLTLTAAGSQITDVAGNLLAVDATDEWDTDTVGPTIAITAVDPDPISGTVASITITASEAIANFSIEDLVFTRDGGANLLTGDQTLDTNDNITFTLTGLTALTGVDGQYTLTLAANGSGIEDTSGNPFETSVEESFEVDTTAPDAPTALALSQESITGSDDTFTSDTTPIITGTAEALSFVQVFIGGVEDGNPAQADAEGNWSHQITGPLAEGENTITATATDDADNTSLASAGFVVTLDTIAPDAPTTPDLATDDDSGDSGVDDITSNTTPTFEGLAEADSLVTLFANGVEVGSATATGGSYAITVSEPLADGDYVFTATATDAAGNVSDLSVASTTVTIDTTANAPTVTGDSMTNDNTPTITGTHEPLSFIEVFINGVSHDTTQADADGNWSLTLASQADGSYVITAQAVDLAGNVSEVSQGHDITIDTVAPDAPAALDLLTADDSGISDSDNLTNNATPTVSGTTEEGSTVELFVGGVSVGTAQVTGTDWSFTFGEGDLSEGLNEVTAKATDAAGNESLASSQLDITLDTTAPDAIAAPTLDVGSNTGDLGDTVTSETQLTINGTAPVGVTVQAFIDGDAAGDSVIADGNGDYSITLPAQADGTYEITVKVVDDAANFSDASPALSVTIDTTAPAAPTIAGDDNTNDTTPTVSGTADETAAFVQVYVDGVANGDPVAVLEGAWTHDVQGPLAEGTFEITATAIDIAGNESVASDTLAVTIDLTAPAAPAGLALDQDSINGISDLHTNVETATINGTTDAETDSLEVFVGGVSVGFAQVIGTAWTFTFAQGDLSEGVNTITAKATDEAGNESDASADFQFTLDLTTPDAPATPDLFADSDTADNEDNITSDNSPVIVGTIEASGRATLLLNGEVFSGQNVDGTGAYEFQLPDLADGSYEVVVNTMDQAGNVSENSQVLTITIDTAAPQAPAASLDDESNSASLEDTITSDSTPTVSVTAEPGSIVEVFVGGVSVDSVFADENGQVSYTFAAENLSEGVNTITFTASDTAGNVSELSDELVVTLDTTAPGSPGRPELAGASQSSQFGAVTGDSSPIIVGSADTGSTVTIFLNGEAVATGVASESVFAIEVPEMPDGDYAVRATATDAAGNVSSLSPTGDFTIDATAPTVEITPVDPDPREAAVDAITIVFSEGIFNFTLANLTLTLAGGENLLTDAQQLTSDDDTTWTLSGLTDLTGSAGVYTLTVNAQGITDQADNEVAEDATESWTFNTQAPTLTIVQTLSGAIKNTPFTITYEDLLDAADEADADGGEIHFKVVELSSGTLTKNDIAVEAGVTTLSEGEELIWTPDANVTGTLNAFTIVANDGFDDSTTAVQVKVTVEKPTVSITVVDDEGAEDGQVPVTFLIERNGTTEGDLVVNYTTVNGQADNGRDFERVTGQIVIPDGESSVLLTITPIDDVLAESDEEVVIVLKSSSHYTVDAENNTASGVIFDDEPTVSIEATDDTATEAGLTTGTFTITLSHAVDQDVTVRYSVIDTASKGRDYVRLSGFVVIAAGDTTATVTITPEQDARSEGDETVTLRLRSSSAYAIDEENNEATATIEDDEPTVSIVATDSEADEEGLATGTFTITLSNAVDQDTKVYFKVNGTARNGRDYEKITGFVIIAAGDTTATVTITPKQDARFEGDELVTLTLRNKRTYHVDEEANAASVTIADNEPVVSVVATEPVAGETGPVPGEFTFTRTGSTALALTVFFAVSGTAGSSDFHSLFSSIVIPEAEESVTLALTPKADNVEELEETVIVTLRSSSTYGIDADANAAIVTIVENLG